MLLTPSESLATYLPRRLVERLEVRGGLPASPSADWFEAATLQVDFFGFNELARGLVGQHSEGAEELTRVLDACLTLLIELVMSSGGDVVSFSTEGLLAVWPVSVSRDLHDAACVATETAQRCHEALAAASIPLAEGLALRIGAGAGEVSLHALGGWGGRWVTVVSGPAVQNMARARLGAGPGQTVIADEMMPLVQGRFEATRAEAGWLIGGVVGEREQPQAPSREEVGIDTAPQSSLRAFIPEAVLHRLDAGQADWLAELRTVSAVYVQLRAIDPARSGDQTALQEVVERAQRTLQRWEGTLNKLVADPSGTTLVIAFGFPPHAHEDGAARAVRTAALLRDLARELGLSFGIGVGSGRAFCGAHGSERRREYMMVGDAVDLAAELMNVARDEVLCDGATVREASSSIGFSPMGTFELPRRGAVAAQRPVGELDVSGRHGVLLGGRAAREGESIGATLGLAYDTLSTVLDPATTAGLVGASTVGRDREQGLLLERLAQLESGGSGGVILLEGEAGYGKSLLAATLHGEALGRGVSSLLGAVEKSARADAWRPWREILTQLFAVQGRDPALVQEEVRTRLPQRERRWAPLLEPVLPLGWTESDATAAMVGASRFQVLLRLLVTLLDHAAAERPRLVFLEDAHWMDRASWGVAEAISEVDGVLLVLICRPMGASAPPEYTAMMARSDAVQVPLGPLPPEQIERLVARRLNARVVPEVVTAAVVDRAEGNPFFAEELAWGLLESGQVDVRQGKVVLLGARLKALDLPDTLQAAITARFDRLLPEVSLTVRVASVLGRQIRWRALLALHPVRDEDALRAQLAELVELDLAVVESTSPAVWSFKHIIVQETAYSLLPFAQRRALHRAVAEWHETHSEDILALPELARHWRRADEPLRAVQVLEEAGVGAVARGANEAGIAMLDEALELVDAEPERVGVEIAMPRRARWLLSQGDAYVQAGEMEAAKDRLACALAVLDVPLPRSNARWALRGLWEMVLHLRYRLLPTPRPAEPERLALAARAASLFGGVCYFTMQPLLWFVGSLLSVNLAERSRSDAPAAPALASIGVILGTMRLHAIARGYLLRARAADVVRDRTVVSWAEATYLLTFCRWSELDAVLAEGLALAEDTGDNYTIGVGATVKAIAAWLHGDPEAAAIGHEEVQDSARERKNLEHLAWSLAFSVPALLELGRRDVARRQLDELMGFADALDPFTRVVSHGVRAQLNARDGDLPAAAREVAHMLDEHATHGITVYTYLPGLAGAAEAVLALRDAAARGEAVPMPEGWSLRRLESRLASVFASSARLYRYMRPGQLLFDGVRRGKRRLVLRARREAESLGLPLEAARAARALERTP